MSVLTPIAEGTYRPIAAIATCSSYGTRPMANKGPIAAIAVHSPTFFIPGSTVSLPIATNLTILAQSMGMTWHAYVFRHVAEECLHD